jgi:hypothetical protein
MGFGPRLICAGSTRPEWGPWTVTGSAALSMRYNPEKQEAIWDVVYSQEMTRPRQR